MSHILSSRPALSRRTLLRGLGASVALPFLDAMAPRGFAAADKAGAAAIPKRFGVLFMPNGVHPQQWTPQGTGTEFTLSPTLKPLERHRSHINVLSGLGHENCRGGDGHYAKSANWLTGTEIAKTTGRDLRCGVSIDQELARRLEGKSRFGSLEMGTEPIMSGVDFNVNYTMLYGSHISWRTPTTPLPPEINPRLVFDRFFRTGKQHHTLSQEKSVLDLVLEDAKALRSRVGKQDQQRLDEYLESLRSVERRISADIARVASGENLDPAAKEELARMESRIQASMKDKVDPGGRLRLDHTEHSRLMMDLMALAFWTDTTRISTFMFGWAVSGKNFSFLDGVQHSHHECSHHENHEDKLKQYQRINEWHVDQFAYLIDRMASLREGEGTLLDNTLLLFGSSMRDGNAHSPKDLPLVLAGHAGGLKGGRHLAYGKGTPLCNLFASTLSLVAPEVAASTPAQFGDSTGLLHDLV